jgi:excisionase family DNA binding protein
VDPILLTPDEAAKALRISRSALYQLLARPLEDGGLESIHIGASRRIPVCALHAWVARQRGEPSQSPGAIPGASPIVLQSAAGLRTVVQTPKGVAGCRRTR